MSQAWSIMVEEVKKLRDGVPAHLRLNLMAKVPPEAGAEEEWGRSPQLEVLYEHNMDLDADALITFAPHEGGVGKCCDERLTQVIDLEWTRDAYEKFQMSRVQQALVRKSLRSLMCVPLFHPDDAQELRSDTQVLGVLNFDSDDEILDEFNLLRKAAMEIAARLMSMWYSLTETGEQK